MVLLQVVAVDADMDRGEHMMWDCIIYLLLYQHPT
jgi:hypothetical protein